MNNNTSSENNNENSPEENNEEEENNSPEENNEEEENNKEEENNSSEENNEEEENSPNENNEDKEDENIFNNSESELDLFSDDEIELEEVIVIPESERVYEDNIYREDLYESLMSEYKIYQRSDKYIIEQVRQKVDDLIDLKNKGLKIIERKNNNIKNKFVEDILNNNYKYPWIVPIINDTKIVFKKIDEKEEENNNDESNIDDTLLDEGYECVSQINMLKELKIIENNYSKDDINHQQYLKESLNILLNPYKVDLENQKGIITNTVKNFSALRYDDINHIFWSYRRLLGPITIETEIEDRETGRIIDIKSEILVKGELINMVGLMILPFGKNIYETLNYSGHNRAFDRFGMIGPIKNVTLTNPAVLTIPDHNLNENDFIYIIGSNTYPSIDGKYILDVKIINKDKISIPVDMVDGIIRSKGFLFTNLKLIFNSYEIIKKNGKLEVKTLNEHKSDYLLPKFYKFGDIDLKDKNNISKVLNLCVPSIDSIIEYEHPYMIEKPYISGFNEILDKYNLKYNELDVRQVDSMKKYMEECSNKIRDELSKIKIKNHKISNNDTTLFKDKDYVFSNHFITNKEIEKYYGKYKLLDSKYDDVHKRLEWISMQKDHGNLYLLTVMIEIFKERKKMDVKRLESQLSIYEGSYEGLKKEIAKENKLKKYLESENTCNAFDFQSMISSSDWKTQLEETGMNHEVGRKALVKKDNKPTIFEWNGKEWKETGEVPKYKMVKTLCEFKNLDFSEIDFNQLDCLFKQQYGCHSVRFYYFEERKNELEKRIANYKELIESLKNKSKDKFYKQHFDNLISLFEIEKTNVEVLNEKNENNNSSEKKSPEKNHTCTEIKKILNKIEKIPNVDERYYLKNKIISVDGFLINKDLYSIKYKCRMMCGHNYYTMLFDKSTSNEQRYNSLLELVNNFGDDGKNVSDKQTCINCGQELVIRGYDDTEGFNALGQIRKSRVEWIEETENMLVEKYTMGNKMLKEEFDNNFCNDHTFKNILMKKGLDFKTIDRTTEVCNILGDLTSKVGISIKKGPILDIILDVIKIIINKPDLEEFIKDEKQKLKQKGLTNRKIELFEEKGAFEKKYDATIKINNYCTITSRLLIEIQTAEQPYTVVEDKGICIFSGFDGEKGIKFFSCILSKILKKSEEVLHDKLKDSYDNYRKYGYIQELYKKRNREEKKEESENFITEYKRIEYSKPAKFNPMSDKDVFHKAHNQTHEIMDLIKEVISKAPPNNPQMILPENSCCNEDIIEFVDYFKYISEHSEDKEKLYKLIANNNELSGMFNLLLNSGSFHKVYLRKMHKPSTEIDIVPLATNVTDDLITNKFVQYIGSGKFKGQKRYYVKGENDVDIDIKTGKNINEIRSHKYSVEDFERLEDIIGKNNMNKFKQFVDFKDEFHEKISELVKDSEDELGTELNVFSKYVAKYHNKSADDIKNSLLNFGNLDKSINKNKEYGTIKQKVVCDRSFDMNKIVEFKNMIIEVSTNSEKIKNQIFHEEIDIHTIDNEEIVKELQKVIYEEYKHLEEYEGEKYQKIFSLLKDDYTLDFIEKLVPKFDIYSCTYKKVKEYSKLNVNQVFTILLYLFVRNINDNFEILKKSANSPDGALTSYGNFISKEIRKHLEYNRIMDISNEELNKIDAREYHSWSKEIKKIDENIKAQKIPPSLAENIYGSSKYSTSVPSDDIEHDKQQLQISQEAKKEAIMSELKDTMSKESGKDPSLADLEDKYNEYVEDQYRDAADEQDEMNMDRPQEDDINIIDVGTGYGEMPQGIEEDPYIPPDSDQKADNLYMEF
jgi:hypothetical protein